MADRELLAAVGEVVIDAAVLEFHIAILVAAIEGRDRDEEWARHELASRPGETRRAFKKLAAARPERLDLARLYRDAVAVLDDRHVIVHSVAQAEMNAADGTWGGLIWHPKSDKEVRLTAPDVREHAHDIRIVVGRARALFVAETADES